MVDADATAEDEWIFEKETMPGLGQGDNVISSRRQNFGLYEADRLADDIVPLAEDVRQLKIELASMKTRVLTSGAAGDNMFKSGFVLGLGAIVGAIMLAF